MSDSTLQLVWQAGWFVKVVLLVLIGLSVGCWAIIFYKIKGLNAVEQQSKNFLEVFRSSVDWKTVQDSAQHARSSPLARLFHMAWANRTNTSQKAMERMLKQQATEEIENLHKHLNFLATTGSNAPFIGLLGTVWGIMDAFRSIGSVGSASLAVVAPAIAEALIATAVGLIAAIPAVMAYNYFLNRIRRTTLQIENFVEMLGEAMQEVPNAG